VIPEWEPARSAEAQEVWSDVLRPVAEGLGRDAGPLSEQALAYIRSQIPELFPDPESAEENRASTEASIRAAAEMIESGGDPRAVKLPAATLAYAQASVRRGVPFPVLIRSYRLGHEAVSDVLFARIAETSDDAETVAAAVRLCSAWIFGFVDNAVTASAEFYEAERERWLRSTAASRAETIEAVLEGQQRDPELASKRLGYRVEREHIGAIAWLEAAETALGEVARAVGADNVLFHPLGVLAAAAWFGSASDFDAAALEAASFDARSTRGVRVALGEPASGIDGFSRSHEEASQARRVASLERRPPGTITRYGQVALRALASANLSQARQFVERELGPLAAEDDVSLRLTGTLRAYLDEQASRSRAANRLGIHENTVSYRVRQAEELLGRRVDERSLDLRVALALADVVRHDGADGAA
jgi:DNA-binding PucR family transcriptional regulator